MTEPLLPESPRVVILAAWRVAEHAATVIALLMGLLVATGWKIQKPGDVMAVNETDIKALALRVTIVEQNYAKIDLTLQTVLRMQCMLVTRRDANMAGTCGGFPTREESVRAR